MFSMDFWKQIQDSARHLFGSRGEPPERTINPGGLPDTETCARYVPPPGVKSVPCHKGPNGEYYPDRDIFAETESAVPETDTLDRRFGNFIRVTDLPVGKIVIAMEEKHGVDPGLKEYYHKSMTITYYGDPPAQEFIDELYRAVEAEGWTLDVKTANAVLPSCATPALE